MSKPERRGVAWTEESGTSDEGRRRTERPEASGRLSTATDGSDSMRGTEHPLLLSPWP